MNTIKELTANPSFQLVRDWGKEKGIVKEGNSMTQYIKLHEEFGELCGAILKNKDHETKDSLSTCEPSHPSHQSGSTNAYEKEKERSGTQHKPRGT